MSQRLLRQAFASAAGAALIVGVAAAPALAASPLALSASTGPSGGGNTLTGTVGSSLFPAGTLPTVQFQYLGTGSSGCSVSARAQEQIAAVGTTATAGAQTVDPAQVRRLSTTKVAFQVPSAAYPATDENGNSNTINQTGLILAGSQIAARWNVCLYDSPSPSGNLLASAFYTLAVRPQITSILPANSPAGGGQQITVNGVGFGSPGGSISAEIGGAPLTGITVATNGNSFTATTTAHASGAALPLTVTTTGGKVSSTDTTGNGGVSVPFTYSNGITITPNTGPVGSVVNVDVFGAGFGPLDFVANDSPTSSNAHVFLVKDAYVAGGNRGVAECGNVIVIGDNELVCTLDLGADQLSPTDSSTVGNTPIADGAYILTVVADGDSGAGVAANPSIVSSGATFTVAPY